MFSNETLCGGVCLRKDEEVESDCSRGCHLPRPLGAEPLHMAQGGSPKTW